MNFDVLLTPNFEKELKRLAKKYASLKNEYLILVDELSVNPFSGDRLSGILEEGYKIRLTIKSKGRGKSGGGRVITYVVRDHSTVLLLSIYDKGEISDLPDKTIKDLVKEAKDYFDTVLNLDEPQSLEEERQSDDDR